MTRRLLTVSIFEQPDKDKGEALWRRCVQGQGVRGTKGIALRLFSGLAGSYDRVLDVTTLLQDRYWKSWVAERSRGGGGLLLDVGSGTLVLEERMMGRGESVVGVDLSKEMIAIGKKKRLGNVVLLVNGDAEHLPFRDGAFDGIASCYVAKYVSVQRFAGELGRVTKPGGTVAAYDFVKPKGPMSLFLVLYIQGGLRILGFLMGLARKGSAFTFKNLPGIVEGTDWDSQMTSAMEVSGFETRAFDTLSGGAVAAYWGVRTSAGSRA